MVTEACIKPNILFCGPLMEQSHACLVKIDIVIFECTVPLKRGLVDALDASAGGAIF